MIPVSGLHSQHGSYSLCVLNQKYIQFCPSSCVGTQIDLAFGYGADVQLQLGSCRNSDRASCELSNWLDVPAQSGKGTVNDELHSIGK